ncbi:MAG: hypothetical protein KDA99_07930 [Planctomycetales bacterium]|nr:hypothetical protein [Planctomycetales bacterium]
MIRKQISQHHVMGWIVTCCLLSLSFVPASGQGTSVDQVVAPRIGFGAVPANYADVEMEWKKVFDKAEEAGAEVVQIPAGSWGENQIGPGRYTWSSETPWYRLIKRQDYHFRVSKDFAGPFQHEEVTSPKDVRFRSFADEAFTRRYLEMVDAYLNSCADATDYLLIHAEGAHEYFAAKPRQLDDYLIFLRTVVAHVHQRNPQIKVSVNTDPQNKDDVLSRMAAELDFISFDVMRSDDLVKQPGDLAKTIDRLIRVAGAKKISIAFYWSTTPVDGGSEAGQLAAFQAAMMRVRERQERFEYVVFGNIVDDDPQVLGPVFRAAFANLPADFVEKITQSQSTQGMIRLDGKEKPAWSWLKREMAEFKQQRTPAK